MQSRGIDDVLVVIPAFNERDALPLVLGELDEVMSLRRVVVVDDGSVDGTAEVAESAGAAVLRMPFNVGVGGALRAGLLFARREGIGRVVQCDADGQHPVAEIPRLLTELDSVDMVIGARFAGEGNYTARGPRRLAMVVLAYVMSKVHRTSLTDVTSGFRGFGPRAIEVLSAELPAEYLGDTIEALAIAKEHRLKVSQIPVEMRARQGGVASQNSARASIYLARAFTMLSLTVLRLLASSLVTRRRRRGKP